MPFQESINPYVSKIREHAQVAIHLDGLWEHFSSSEAILDLGCGNGHFLESYVAGSETRRGLGVEKKFKRIFKSAQKLRESNSKVLKHDVHEFLKASPEEFWSEVWLQFPDPWPKARHEKNRMVRPSLLPEVHRVLKSGGRFCFRSDHKNYWDDLLRWQDESKIFGSSRQLVGDLFTHAPQTLFQKIFLSKNIPIYSLEFQK